MRILLVDDDQSFGNALVKHLTREGHAVDWIRCGRDFDAAIAGQRHDCVLLDLTLPDARGEDLLRSNVLASAQVPCIVISGRHRVDDRIALLDMGADDYLVKPVDLLEVSAKIRTLVRRSARDHSSASEIRRGTLVIDSSKHSALWHERQVNLTRKEFWVLEMLVRNHRQILSRSRLEETLYAWGDEIESNAVEVYIHKLRRKFSPRLIVTYRGVGYQLGAAESYA